MREKRMKAVNKTVVTMLLLFMATQLFAVNDSTGIHRRRLRTLVVGSTAAYGLTMYALGELWYKGHEKGSFRFFNDNPEWKQVDKVGHFYSAFYFSHTSSDALTWAGANASKSNLIGSLIGFGVMLPIEILDGFSSAYGASAGDLAANAAGAAFYFGQKALWHEIRIYPKFSFQTTHYPPLRRHVLGDNQVSEFFKDYNGQTYWLSVDMDKFMQFPRWLNLAAGYGAHGMVYARDQQNVDAGYQRPYRQYYLSLDLDLRSIHAKSKFVKTLIYAASMIRLPAPTLEVSHKHAYFHVLYF